MKAGFTGLMVLLSFTLNACAQPMTDAQIPVDKNKAIIVLTYDDTMLSHLDVAIPQLDAAGLRGTFYISANGTGLDGRISDWRAAANRGHELGNHTLFHPCKATGDRDWVRPYYDLSQYTAHQFEEEIRLTNSLLHAIDGKDRRSFAYTCGDIDIKDRQDMIPILKKHVSAARTVNYGMDNPANFDRYLIKTYNGAGKTGAELIAMAEAAKTENALLTFLFHGLDNSEHLVTSAKAHQELVDYLEGQKDEIWVAPLQDVLDALDK